MKKRILIASLFLAAYLVFLLATLPAALVARHLPLPANVASLLKLEGVVNRTAFNHKIKIARLQPQAQELQVWIDTVQFDDLLLWLSTLVEQHGIQVQIIEIAREDLAPGLVKVRRLQLSRPQ